MRRKGLLPEHSPSALTGRIDGRENTAGRIIGITLALRTLHSSGLMPPAKRLPIVPVPNHSRPPASRLWPIFTRIVVPVRNFAFRRGFRRLRPDSAQKCPVATSRIFRERIHFFTGNATMSQMVIDEQDRGSAMMQPDPTPARHSASPEKPELPDRLPPALRLSQHSAIFALALGMTFWFCCIRPIWHSDVWGHLSYGEWISNNRQVPTTEPLMPLAKGVPWVDTAWLAQLGGLGLYQLWGLVGLQFGFAVAVTLSVGFLLRAIYRRTRSAAWGLLGIALFGLVNFHQLFVDFPAIYALWRPQLAGVVCFAAVFNWLASGRIRKADWFIIPALCALWANLHGSFLMGLGLIGLCTLGRAWDVRSRTGSFAAISRDRQTVSWFLILELSAVAALLNPYGLGLYFEVLNFSNSPNLQDLLDWEPLTLRRSQGQWFVGMVIALMAVYRQTPRRISAREVLLLVGLGLWTMWTSRILVWWTIPAVYCFTLHASAVWNRRLGKPVCFMTPPSRKGLWTVATIGLCWIFFAISPIGVRVMHGRQLDFKKAVSYGTPVDAVEFLKQEKPTGLIYNAYEWGDYLRWAGGPEMKIFLNSHAHLVPAEVWRSHHAISIASSGALDLLDRYGAEFVFVDIARHRELVSGLNKSNEWREIYRDGIAVILKRNKPI